MTPFDEVIIKEIKRIERSGKLARSLILAELLGTSQRYVQERLHWLETRQKVARPRGPRSGWGLCAN